jgi:pyruvate/2-oxoglutarate dehydrogenase complex dihydrolipoamide dehydrogenase (E3) component/uncharacterized membrane protein YdjX (TVP38/TMEM64 family)
MKKTPLVRLLFLGVLVAAGAFCAWYFRDKLEPALQWVRDLGYWGLVILGAAYLPSALVAFPPAFLLTIAAGAFYDIVPAVIAISLGSTLAATCAFLLGRTLARGWVEANVANRPVFKALDTAVAEGGFKIVLLTRLSPLLPFFVLNYAYGLTKVKLRDFVLASWIGMLPGTLLYVYIGSTVRGAADAVLAGGKPPDSGVAGRVLWWIGLGATVLVTVLVTRQARQALQKTLKTNEGEGEGEDKDKGPPTPQGGDHPAEPLTVAPPDEFNRKLLDNVHPSNWVNPAPPPRYHLVVVGAGTAGLVTAAGAAGLGARVALIERDLFGGDCLNVGCVPSKALLRAARAAAEVRAAGRFGVHTGEVAVDFPAVMERLRRLRSDMSGNDSASRFRGLGVDVYLGGGKFTGKDTVEVAGKILRFRRAAVTTGARAAKPDISGLADVGYLTNETVFNLTELPRRLAVVGAGPIGCELAQAFARFGSEVALLGKQPSLLPREDAKASELVKQAMVQDGVKLFLGVGVMRAEKNGMDKILHLADGREVRADAILVGVGRTPNVEWLGLEAAGVTYDPKKGIHVDDRLRTSNPRIFSAGDVCSRYQFTHAADAMARIVIQNALFYGGAKVSNLTVPWCTYTEPEVAHVGLYEHEAKEKGVEVDVFTQEMRHVDRAILDGDTEGFVKILVRKGTDRIVGVDIVARHAGEMISELTAVMVAKGGLRTLGQTIHPYPTQAEALRKVADVYSRTRLTPFVKGLFGKWFRWTE